MKILILTATPNDDGLTASAVERAKNGALAEKAEVEIVNLRKDNLMSCKTCGNGWGSCKKNGTCILPDVFADVYDKLRAADGIIWITPVYWHDFSEYMKYFVDRLRRCETQKNHDLEGKKNMLVACAGGTGRGASQCLYIMEDSLNHMKMDSYERIPVIRFNQDYMLPAVEQAGARFARFVNGTEPFSIFNR